MEITVLGSGTGLPSLRRAYPGLLFKIGEANVLFDCGPGTLRQLLKIGVSYNDITCVCLSHLHPDHTLDLASILFANKNPVAPRVRELIVIGPNGFKEFYNKLISIYGMALLPDSYSFIIKEVSDDRIDFDNWSIFTKPVQHTEYSIGFRVETKNDRAVAYSGDTDYCKNVIELSKNADLAILECSFPDEAGADTPGHLTPNKASRIASQANCKKLMLTHFYPVCDNYDILAACSKYFAGQTILASDFLTIDI